MHHAGQRLEDHLAAAPVPERSVVAEVGHQRDDALRIGRLQGVAVGIEADDDRVGALTSSSSCARPCSVVRSITSDPLPRLRWKNSSEPTPSFAGSNGGIA